MVEIATGTHWDTLNSVYGMRNITPSVEMYEESLPTISAHNPRSYDSSDQGINGCLSHIAEGLYLLPSVEAIYVTIEESEIDIWVVLPERDITILKEIVEKELELSRPLIAGGTQVFLIDFHVIYRCGRGIKDIAPTRAIRIPKEVS